MNRVNPGQLYYHYKHITENKDSDPFFMCYRVIGIGGLSENNEYRKHVIYEPVMYFDHADKLSISCYIRPLDEFVEEISKGGYTGPRFKLIEDGTALSRIHAIEELADEIDGIIEG